MNRLTALWKSSPRSVLGAAAALTVAGAVVVGSGASFTSVSANPGNAFTAGTLTHLNSKAGALIVTASNMKPGDTATVGVVDITNNATLPSTFSLSKTLTTNTPGANGGALGAILNVKIDDCGVPEAGVLCTTPNATVPYDGGVTSMGTISLGTFAAGAAKRYRFTVSFPDGGLPATATTGDNAFQGSLATVKYDWSGTQ